MHCLLGIALLGSNECAVDDGGCSELCRNLNGSFECYWLCSDGYRMSNQTNNYCSANLSTIIIILYFKQILMNVLKEWMSVSICA